MYFVKTPDRIQRLFSGYQWMGNPQGRTIYLTFDDGPIPEATPWVLDTLKKFEIPATFFCVGQNVEKHPDIYNRIQAEGHAIGNHTYTHMSAWKNRHDPYLRDIAKAASVIKSNLFRPPYGRLTPRKSTSIREHFKIVMWDILSGDFDPKVSPEQCYNNVYSNIQSGSIVVFHDSLKSIDTLKAFLPELIHQLLEDGYAFDVVK